MKFKVDENLPIEIAATLRDAAHDALTVLDEGLGGRIDANIAEVCKREDRARVTLDLDFSNVRAYPPSEYPGLVVLRVGRQDKAHVLAVFANAVALLDGSPVDRYESRLGKIQRRHGYQLTYYGAFRMR